MRTSLYLLFALALVAIGVVLGTIIHRKQAGDDDSSSGTPGAHQRPAPGEGADPILNRAQGRYDPEYGDPGKQELREAGLLPAMESPVFRLVGDDGRLTQDAIQAAGLDDTQVEEIQVLLNSAFEKIGEKVLANMRYETGSDGSVQVVVPPIPDGQVVLNELKEGIRSTVPSGEASLLIASFPSVRYFAGFGRFESTLELALLRDPSNPSADEEGIVRRVTFSTRDTKDDRKIQWGSRVVDNFGEFPYFPDTFTDTHANRYE